MRSASSRTAEMLWDPVTPMFTIWFIDEALAGNVALEYLLFRNLQNRFLSIRILSANNSNNELELIFETASGYIYIPETYYTVLTNTSK